MRDIYFLFPKMNITSSGHLAQMRLLETARRVTLAHAVVHESRDGNVPFLDDILQSGEALLSFIWQRSNDRLKPGSNGTREWIRLHSPASPFVWIVRQALDEDATDALYEATPFVYVLPNFLPRNVRRKFVHHLRKIWKVASINTLNSAWHDPARAGVDLAGK